MTIATTNHIYVVTSGTDTHWFAVPTAAVTIKALDDYPMQDSSLKKSKGDKKRDKAERRRRWGI